MMPDLPLKLANARELVEVGAVKQAEVIGSPGGWSVRLQTLTAPRVLATKANAPRRFPTFESALRVLRQMGLGLEQVLVNAEHWDSEGGAGLRRRPDRSEAMKLKDADARYANYLREGLQAARADTRPALTAEQARQHMDAVKAKHTARLTEAQAAFEPHA